MAEQFGRSAIQSAMAMVSSMQFGGEGGQRTRASYEATAKLWATLEPRERSAVAIGLTAIVCDLLAARAEAVGISVEEALAVYGQAAASVEFKKPD